MIWETLMEKTLTIAVPAFNAAKYLEKCFASVTGGDVAADIEVIVVNDGSTDNTGELAAEYSEKYPGIISVIDKENGGHGSGINAAIKKAAGKYFKVLDADDTLRSENMAAYIEALKSTDADVVLTNFETVDMTTGRVQLFATNGIEYGRKYTAEELKDFPREAFACSTFHGITYNTDFYRQSGVVLSEKIFYEDQEYATLPYLKMDSLVAFDIVLYEYMIGNAEQSVSDQNQVKRKDQIERVTWNIVDCYVENPQMGEGRKRYFEHKISDIVLSYYVVSLIKNRDRKQGRADAEHMRTTLGEKCPLLVEKTDRKYKIVRTLGRLHINNDRLEKMKQSRFYMKLFRAVRGK